MENISTDELAEILSLDLFTLTEHTLAAGDKFDANTHRNALSGALKKSELFRIRRNGELAAYCYIWPKSKELWFIGGFTIHPQFRNAAIMLDLLSQLSSFLSNVGATTVQSNVYKTNRLSVAFHKKLGFRVTRENNKGFEFTAYIDELKQKPWANT